MVRKPVVLDTNLLLLFAAGSIDPALIAVHKRLVGYGIEDFHWIQAAVAQSGGLILCPNVMSETSNLIRYARRHVADKIAHALKVLAGNVPERYIQSGLAAQNADYLRLGITDAVLIMLATVDAKLITSDLDLAVAAERRGADVINYNHIRDNR